MIVLFATITELLFVIVLFLFNVSCYKLQYSMACFSPIPVVCKAISVHAPCRKSSSPEVGVGLGNAFVSKIVNFCVLSLYK